MIAVIVIVLAVGIFAAGHYVGARVEAAGIAASLKVDALVKAEYRAVIADIKLKETAALSKLKAIL